MLVAPVWCSVVVFGVGLVIGVGLVLVAVLVGGGSWCLMVLLGVGWCNLVWFGVGWNLRKDVDNVACVVWCCWCWFGVVCR